MGTEGMERLRVGLRPYVGSFGFLGSNTRDYKRIRLSHLIKVIEAVCGIILRNHILTD